MYTSKTSWILKFATSEQRNVKNKPTEKPMFLRLRSYLPYQPGISYKLIMDLKHTATNRT